MKYGTFKYGDGTLYGKNASLEDSVGVGDNLRKSIAISLSDSINISEFATRQIHSSLTDSQSISEVIANTTSLKVSESVNITESLSKDIYFSLSDSIVFNENLVKNIQPLLSDIISFGENLFTSAIGKLSLGDSVSLSEGKIIGLETILTDSQSLAEGISKIVNELIISDSISIQESLANKTTLGIGDSIPINEQIQTGGEKTKELSDTLSIGEKAILSYGKRIIDILLKIQPVLTSKAEFFREFNDDISISETQGFGWREELEDGISVYSDDLYKSISKSGLAEQIYFTESIIANRKIVLFKSDNISVSENLETVFGINREITDSISISELLTKSIEVLKSETFADLFDLPNVGIGKPLSDTLFIGETVGNAITIGFSDSILITESAYYGKTLDLLDGISINEDLLKIFGKKPSDSILTAEKTEKSIEIRFAESVSLIEQLANVATVAISDLTTISEFFAKQVEFLREIDDLIGFQENQTLATGKSLSESINLSDNVLNEIGKTLIDSLHFNETSVVGIDKNVSDSLSLNEAAEKEIKISFADNLSITEQSDQELIQPHEELLDSIGIEEESEINIGVNFKEAVGFTEQIGVSEIKIHYDDLTINEQLKIRLNKEKTDNLSIFETKTKKIIKEFSESVNIIESSGGENFINLSDIIAVLEEQFNSINKNFSETFDIAEEQIRKIKVRLSDNLILNDLFVSTTDFYREKEDTIGITESVNLKTNPGLSDGIPITEAVVYDYIKNLSESVFLKAEYYSPTHNIKRIAQKGFFRDDKQSTYLRNKSQKAYLRGMPKIIYLRQNKER